MAPAFRIREATSADVPAVIALFGLLDDQHTAGAPHRFRGASARPRPARDVAALLDNPAATILVAELDARVVGQALVEIRDVPDQEPFVPRRYGQVHDLVVVDDLRRQGIGRALMGAVERWVQARGVETVELIVYEFNAHALRLYEELGYVVDFRRLIRKL